MKKLILSIIFGLSFFFVNAQGNLQFNQVLTYSGSLTSSGGEQVFSPDYTVPTGKVWKVEFASGDKYNADLVINNISKIDISRTGSITTAIPYTSFWLKGDDVLKTSYNVGSGASTMTYFISIIEYNIIP